MALAPKLGRQPNPQVAIEAEKLLSESLEKIETFWLQGSGPFLLGNSEPSIADLSLVCEIMQLEVNGLYPMSHGSSMLGKAPGWHVTQHDCQIWIGDCSFKPDITVEISRPFS